MWNICCSIQICSTGPKLILSFFLPFFAKTKCILNQSFNVFFRLISELWIGHFSAWICFHLTHFVTLLVVIFRSLSCSNLHASLKSFATSWKFLLKVFFYLSQSIFPLTLNSLTASPHHAASPTLSIQPFPTCLFCPVCFCHGEPQM